MTTVIAPTVHAPTTAARASVYVASVVVVMALARVVLTLAPALLRRFGRTELDVSTRIMWGSS